MGVILLFVVGFIVFIIFILSVIKIVTSKVAVPTNDLNEKIARLEKRIDEVENQTENNT